jgi:hypothetical protein
MKRTFIAAMGVAAAVANHIPGAIGGEITVTNIAMPHEETLTVGNPLSPAEGAYVGELVLTASTGETIDAWCIDLFHDAYLGNQSPNFGYEIEPIATNNDPNYASGNILTAAQISEIGGLVSFGNTLIANDVAANDAAATIDQDSAAVQLAIWSVEYGTASSPLVYSNYAPAGPAPASLVSETTDLVDAVEANPSNYPGSALEMWGEDGQQSYAVAVAAPTTGDASIPEPGSLAVLSSALIVLGLLRHRAKPRTAATRPAA